MSSKSFGSFNLFHLTECLSLSYSGSPAYSLINSKFVNYSYTTCDYGVWFLNKHFLLVFLLALDQFVEQTIMLSCWFRCDQIHCNQHCEFDHTVDLFCSTKPSFLTKPIFGDGLSAVYLCTVFMTYTGNRTKLGLASSIPFI
jgi:hypothetical protein